MFSCISVRLAFYLIGERHSNIYTDFCHNVSFVVVMFKIVSLRVKGI